MPWAAAQELHCAASGRGAGVSPGSNEQGDHGRSEGEMRVDAACTGVEGLRVARATPAVTKSAAAHAHVLQALNKSCDAWQRPARAWAH